MPIVNTGYPINKVDLDNLMGRQVVAVRTSLADIVRFKASWLDDTTLGTDANLTTLGYSAGDITTIRASYADIKKLSDIASAVATQGSVNDFWFNAKHLIGLNV